MKTKTLLKIRKLKKLVATLQRALRTEGKVGPPSSTDKSDRVFLTSASVWPSPTKEPSLYGIARFIHKHHGVISMNIVRAWCPSLNKRHGTKYTRNSIEKAVRNHDAFCVEKFQKGNEYHSPWGEW